MSINKGDILVLGSAFFWTAHILVLDRWASRVDTLALACIQFAVCSILCWTAVGLVETPTVASFVQAALPILYGGIFSIGVAYTLQAIAQSRAHPSRASIIMSLEAPFAAVAGFLFLGERLGVRELVGCTLMLGGMIVAQAMPVPLKALK
jgi:drug/metabolite transporter (DMT)-like permease